MTEYITTHQAECVDCYRCLRTCPVKSISFMTRQARIDEDRCIMCGQCVTACPQKAKVYLDQSEAVSRLLDGEVPVVLSLAPSFLASFEEAPAQLYQILRSVGFAQVEETAIGAHFTTEAYRSLLQNSQWQKKTGLSTCCPVIVDLVEKYYPRLQSNLLPVLSPMVAHDRWIRNQSKGSVKVVFAGPCIAKLQEAQRFGLDGALTFEQLKILILRRQSRAKGKETANESTARWEELWLPTRSYPIHNGVLFSVKGAWGSNQDYWSIEGLDQCLEVLNAMENGDIHPRFIEMMACQGGCVGGPAIDSKHTLYRRKQVIQDMVAHGEGCPIEILPEADFPMTKDFRDRSFQLCPFSEEEIHKVLVQMGKPSVQDERNCGGCGYNSCRDKAIGVLNGLATIEMCIPAMRAKAESLSHTVLENTPNGILVIDSHMKLREFNEAAQRIFKPLHFAAGMDASSLDLENRYGQAMKTGRQLDDLPMNYPQWDLITLQTLVPIPSENLLLVVIEDITQREIDQREVKEMKIQVMAKAKKVIDQQMTVAQTIASLLGETTAETKASLYELMKHLEGSNDDHLL